MAIAIALIVIVLGSIIFHFWSPWTMTPLASNWGSIDDTMLITFIITGIVFIAINFFIAFAVISFRHKTGRKAKYEPENKKLELWLTIGTSVGIIAMLAPGLVVYADFVNVPEDALEVEVVGQQWSWSFRFPGRDGKLGKSAVEHISIDNPFGVDPLDEAGQDDHLVFANRVSLPIDKPIKVLLRSKDVLHDFYVPQFRVKMDMVPGTVSYLWFTATVLGEFEILCAEFCGLGHFNMRGKVDVLSAQDFEQWLNEQPTFAVSLQKNQSEQLSVVAQNGKEVAQTKGCLACHNFTDSAIGPTWQNLYGKTQTMVDGSQVLVNDDYLTEAILKPTAKVVKGFAPIMPVLPLSDLEVKALIAFIKEKGQQQDSAVEKTLKGAELVQAKGCLACHSQDGSKMLGPSWKGLFGQRRTLNSGQTIVVDEAYLRESIFQPNAKIVAGYPAVMPPPMLSQEEAQAIVELIKTL
jgi:cytochrome c oxidase subunit 2